MSEHSSRGKGSTFIEHLPGMKRCFQPDCEIGVIIPIDRHRLREVKEITQGK